jgi:hypothetical protein
MRSFFNYGYPAGFREAENEYLGITEPIPEIEPRPSFVDRRELLPIRSELRYLTNKLNNIKDKPKFQEIQDSQETQYLQEIQGIQEFQKNQKGE